MNAQFVIKINRLILMNIFKKKSDRNYMKATWKLKIEKIQFKTWKGKHLVIKFGYLRICIFARILQAFQNFAFTPDLTQASLFVKFGFY